MKIFKLLILSLFLNSNLWSAPTILIYPLGNKDQGIEFLFLDEEVEIKNEDVHYQTTKIKLNHHTVNYYRYIDFLTPNRKESGNSVAQQVWYPFALLFSSALEIPTSIVKLPMFFARQYSSMDAFQKVFRRANRTKEYAEIQVTPFQFEAMKEALSNSIRKERQTQEEDR